MFQVLSRSRPVTGMGGASGIPFSEILSYLWWQGVQTMEEQESCLRLILTMDAVYLSHIAERHQAASRRT